MNAEQIKATAKLGLTLTARERAEYLLFIASDEELKQFLAYEGTNND